MSATKVLPLSGLGIIVAACWAYLLTAGMALTTNVMSMPNGAAMAMPVEWTPAFGLRVFCMWAIMMLAMMLPSVMPAIARLSGTSAMLSFAALYTAVWTGFALFAALGHWQLSAAGLLAGGMTIQNKPLAGALLVAIGLYQLAPPLVRALERCRAGNDYAVSCLRCCAPLMLVLFVVGIMNVTWWIVLALWVLAEKSWTHGVRLARIGGFALIVWGATQL